MAGDALWQKSSEESIDFFFAFCILWFASSLMMPIQSSSSINIFYLSNHIKSITSIIYIQYIITWNIPNVMFCPSWVILLGMYSSKKIAHWNCLLLYYYRVIIHEEVVLSHTFWRKVQNKRKRINKPSAQLKRQIANMSKRKGRLFLQFSLTSTREF